MENELYDDDSVQQMQHLVHMTAVEHGWWEKATINIVPEKLALIHAEVSEALEEYRDQKMETYYSGDKRKPEGFGIELADAVIRIFDLAAWLGLDMGALIAEKHNFNLSRSYKHGGKVC